MIAPVAGIPFYVAGFEAGWRVVESGMRVAGNMLAGGVETDASEFTRRPRPRFSGEERVRRKRDRWAVEIGLKTTLTTAGGSCAWRLGPMACTATS